MYIWGYICDALPACTDLYARKRSSTTACLSTILCTFRSGREPSVTLLTTASAFIFSLIIISLKVLVQWNFFFETTNSTLEENKFMGFRDRGFFIRSKVVGNFMRNNL